MQLSYLAKENRFSYSEPICGSDCVQYEASGLIIDVRIGHVCNGLSQSNTCSYRWLSVIE